MKIPSKTLCSWPTNTDEVKDLHRDAKDFKEVVAEQILDLIFLKNSVDALLMVCKKITAEQRVAVTKFILFTNHV